MKTYNLKDIAKELDVSRATIDRVIHNRGGIGKETEQRVRDFLEKVNYTPNKLGKSLGKRLQKNIFIIFHDDQNEFFEDLKLGIKAAEAEVKDFGFTINILAVNNNSESQIQIIKEIISEGADAIAISPYEVEKFVDIIDELTEKGVPVITFNNDVVNSTRLCYVGTNYYKSGRIAGEVLGKSIKSGKVAILSCRSNYWHSQQRIAGFREVMSEYGDIQLIGPYKNLSDYESSYNNTKEIINAVNDLKGIFLLDNEKGVISGVCGALRDFSKNKIDLVTLDLNTECIEGIKNGIIMATVSQDPYSQGYYSVKILFNYLFDNQLPKSSVYLTRLDVIFKENMDNYDSKREIIVSY